jgi:phospholipid-transporting ATPase
MKIHEKKSTFDNSQLFEQSNTKICVALGGASFRVIYNDENFRKEFSRFIPYISVVVGARVTPGQKAEFVTLVKTALPEVKTLAVGDGANDVNMICTANVGVAIFGKEGLQASTASDYSIPEFKMLKPLLLHRGSEFCRINQNYIFYNFYKNFLLCFPQIL